MFEEAQEPKRSTVAAAVTAREKRAIELVATVDGKTVSDLLRPAIDEIVIRGQELAGRLRDMEKVA